MEQKTLFQVELKSIGVIQGDLEALENIADILLDSALHMSTMVGFCAKRVDQKGVRVFTGLHDKRIEDFESLSDLIDVINSSRSEALMKLNTSSDYGSSVKEEP